MPKVAFSQGENILLCCVSYCTLVCADAKIILNETNAQYVTFDVDDCSDVDSQIEGVATSLDGTQEDVSDHNNNSSWIDDMCG